MGHPTDIFVPQASSGFLCAICHDVLKDASTFRECGHSFCGECIANCLRVPAPIHTCPNCRTEVTGSNPNFALREIVESLPVRCPEWKGGDASRKRKRADGGDEDEDDRANGNTGCEWTGQLKDLKCHEVDCPHKFIACHVAGCTHRCKRRDMASHHASTTGILMHAELRHTTAMAAMELRYESKIKAIEAKYEHMIRQMELRYESHAAKMRLDMRFWEQEHKKKLEKKLKREMEVLETNVYLRLCERGPDSPSPRGAPENPEAEQALMAGYGGLTSLNSAVFQYIKNEGASCDHGVHVNDIIVDSSLSHGVFEGDVQAAITHLLNKGLICTTIDNHNYRVSRRTELSGAVIQFIKNANAESGSLVSDICRGLDAQGFSFPDILNEIEKLSNKGYIYSTIDEFHYGVSSLP